jgi:glycosyltransferase involved in cell wall biosynthesis
LASNPRLVKEADALHEAGYTVRVVAGDTTPGVRVLDNAILARANWPVTKVGLGDRLLHLARRTRQELFKGVVASAIGGVREAVWAHSPVTRSLAKAAAAEPADLYIGHYLAALPAVAWAAHRYGVKLGFDAEDDHVGELEDIPGNRTEIAVRRKIESYFLPQCHHLTASSPGIARAYHDRYGLTMIPILNVFPLAQAPDFGAARHPHKSGDQYSVYWFSQTIGPGRGLEPIIRALGKLHGRVTLSIRGSDFLGYSAHLKALAAEAGSADMISFLPSAPPDEMARLAAQHDIGLASELGTPPNHAICLSNKIFTYLLAGVPVLLSDTPAQREIAGQLGLAARLIDLNRPDEIAQTLHDWTANPETLAASKREAWECSQTRFSWDIEKARFLQSVRETLEVDQTKDMAKHSHPGH